MLNRLRYGWREEANAEAQNSESGRGGGEEAGEGAEGAQKCQKAKCAPISCAVGMPFQAGSPAVEMAMITLLETSPAGAGSVCTGQGWAGPVLWEWLPVLVLRPRRAPPSLLHLGLPWSQRPLPSGQTGPIIPFWALGHSEGWTELTRGELLLPPRKRGDYHHSPPTV